MKNLKLNTKFMLCFSAILITLLICSFFSIYNTLALRDVIYEYKDYSVKNTEYLWNIRRNLVAIHRDLMYAVLAKSPDDIEKYINDVQQTEKNTREIIEMYKKTIRTNDSALLDAFVKLLDDTAAKKQQIIDLSRQNTEQSNSRAYNLALDYKNEFDLVIVNTVEKLKTDQELLDDQQEKYSSDVVNMSIVIVSCLLVLPFLITIFIITIIRKSVVKPIKKIERAASEIANGNLDFNLKAHSSDEIGMLIRAIDKVKNTISNLVENINTMSHEFEHGDVDARIDDTAFEGVYNTVANSINSSFHSIISDMLEIFVFLNEFGNGNFDIDIKTYPGKKVVATETLNSFKKNLISIKKDMSKVIESAIEGKLNDRVDVSEYKGDWQNMANGLNELMQVIRTPIDEANKVLNELAKGNFNLEITKDCKGTFASMMRSFEKMIASIGSYISEITQILENIAKGNLSNQIERPYLGDFNLIKNSINNITSTLRYTIKEIKLSADSVSLGSKLISENSMQLANGATSQASSIEELNASIITINQHTIEKTQKAEYSDSLAKKSMESAKIGKEQMENMLISMDAIKDASNNISNIIKVIDDIAFQTNILALNASVEAARTGHLGKGFAVVADEVRSLAEKSQKAARETAELIEDTIEKLSVGTELANATADALIVIISDISSVSDTINSIYVATQEQLEEVSQITFGINQISDVVQKNSSTSEEFAAAAQELNSQSEVLAQMVSEFNV